MSSNFVSGLVSGLDSTALIDAIIASRSRPILLLEQRQAEKTAQLSAWQSLETILISMKIETDRLGQPALWETPLVTSSDEDVLTATADSGAVLEAYDFFVAQLAQSEQRRSQAYSSKDEPVGSGTLSITVGTDTTDLTVEDGSSLEDLAELINLSDAGVSASIVRSVESGSDVFHLVLTGDETGEANTISVSSTLTGGTAPDLSTTVRAALDAKVHFGGEGGLELSSATNVFEDVVEGLDVTVHRTHEAGSDDRVTVEVGRNTANIETVLTNFVDRYNAVVSFINQQFRYDPQVGSRPPLMGDSTLTNIGANLRSLATRPVVGLEGAEFRTLFGVGIKSTSDGTLSFDETQFRDALETNFDAVAALFRAQASFDAPGVEWLGAPDDVQLGGQAVQLVISEAATRATITGDLVDVAGGITIDASNDAFKIKIDGVLSDELTLAHGTYTDGEALAQAIADAVEDSEDLGALGVRVTFEDAGGGLGNLVFTSNRYGADGTLQLVTAGGDFALTLGLSGVMNTSVAGTDVVGTINGVAAEGKGRVLTAGDDVEGFAGISFRVTAGTSDVPLNVTSSFSEGIGRVVSRRIESLTDAADGTLSRVGSSIQRLIDGIAADIETKTEQLEKRRLRLQNRYAQLETTLGQLQNQSLFLNAQLQSTRSVGFGINQS